MAKIKGYGEESKITNYDSDHKQKINFKLVSIKQMRLNVDMFCNFQNKLTVNITLKICNNHINAY